MNAISLLTYPVEHPDIWQAFGVDNTNHPQRNNFYRLFDNIHCGVDFQTTIGTPVYAAYDGIVVRKDYHHPGMGKVIGIRNGNIVMLYAHLSHIAVKLGQIVSQGDVIALSGNTGKATTGPHLHFEIRDISKPTLKEMVFDPPFGNVIAEWRATFTYTVNNKNTRKSLASLSRLYFGVPQWWRLIRQHNPALARVHKNSTLAEGAGITIPNYTFE